MVRANPHLAIGVPSGSGVAHARRRAAIRVSWLRYAEFRSGGVALGMFILRCGANASSALRAEAARHANDTLCSPIGHSCLNDACRTRGVVLALMYWLQFSVTALPKSIRWIAKADDDVFVNVPLIVAHLDAIPAATLAPWAFYGTPGYFSTLENETMLIPRGYAPGYRFALQVARRHALQQQCGDGRRTSGQSGARSSAHGDRHATCRLIGPFPFMCGQFFALGTELVRYVLSQAGGDTLRREERRISALPDSNPLVTEDVWLGSMLHRFLEARAATAHGQRQTSRASRDTPQHIGLASRRRPHLALFSLEGQRSLWVDPTRARGSELRVPTTLAIYHNRLRIHSWMGRLFTFTNSLQRCAVPVRWRPRFAFEGAGARGAWDVGWSVHTLPAVHSAGDQGPRSSMRKACIPSTVDLLDPLSEALYNS